MNRFSMTARAVGVRSNIVIVGIGNVGFALAERLVKTERLHLVDRQPSAQILSLVKLGATFAAVDATDIDAMSAEIIRINTLWSEPIDAFVVTVGGFSQATPFTSFSSFKAYFDRNVFGVLVPIKAWLATHQVAPCRIVVLSSTSGHHAPGTLDSYAPSKWALENLCGAIGAELSGQGSSLEVVIPTNLVNATSHEFLSSRGLAPGRVANAITQRLKATTRQRSYGRRYLPQYYRAVHVLERGAPWILDLAARVPFRGKSATRYRCGLITGASSGLGRELALLYADVTEELILTARSSAALDGLKREIESRSPCRVRVCPVDLSDLEAVAQFAKQLPDVELLINNAGTHVTGRIKDTSKEVFQRTFAVNFFSPVILTAECLSRGGSLKKVVNILSTTAIAGRRDLGAYSASKGALWSFTRSLRRVCGSQVEVMEVLPATFTSDLAKKGLRIRDENVDGEEGASRAPQGRVLTSAQVARRTFRAEQHGQRRVSMPVEARMLLWLELVTPGVFARVFQR